MVVIRLARSGAKKRPFYHIVAADKRSPRDGRNIEQIGYYNPVARGAETGLHINLERIEYWKSVGAKPSDRITFLLKKYKKQLLEKEQVAEKPTQNLAKEQAVDGQAQEKAVQAEEPVTEEQTHSEMPTEAEPAEVEKESVDTKVQQQKPETEEKS